MKLQFIACVIVILVIIECESRPRRRIPATQKLSPEDLRQPPRQVRRSVAVPSDNIEKPRKADLDLEYRRYLDQVIEALESDPNFKKRLESLSQDDLEKGYIKSEELDLINHQIRSRLDVIKRREVERIRYLSMRQYEESQGMDRDHIKVPDHLDLTGGTFEREDLKLLIKAAAKDLDEVDRARKEDFKRYEMEKKFQREEQLKKIENELERRKEEQKIRQMEEKHKDHEKPHHPMTKDQLEEVWEEQDKMEAKDFDPKTFFALHDLNGDDHWDEDEVRILFLKELKKVYDPNAPEDDMREREEEMELMREHTFKESDLNEDRLISREEFLKETKREEFEKDPGWDTIDSNEGADITDEEFKAYQEKRQKEIEERLKDEKHPPGSVNDGSDVPAVVQPGIEQNQAELEIDENDKEVSNNGDGKGGAESVNQDQLPPVPQPNPPQPEEPEVNLAHGL